MAVDCAVDVKPSRPRESDYPSRGVRPMLVSMHLPFSIAHMLAPAPVYHTLISEILLATILRYTLAAPFVEHPPVPITKAG